MVRACVRACVRVCACVCVPTSLLQEKSSAKVAAGILKESGPLGFWQGVGPDVSRGVLSAALMLAIKEKLQVVIKALLGLQK